MKPATFMLVCLEFPGSGIGRQSCSMFLFSGIPIATTGASRKQSSEVQPRDDAQGAFAALRGVVRFPRFSKRDQGATTMLIYGDAPGKPTCLRRQPRTCSGPASPTSTSHFVPGLSGIPSTARKALTKLRLGHPSAPWSPQRSVAGLQDLVNSLAENGDVFVGRSGGWEELALLKGVLGSMLSQP